MIYNKKEAYNMQHINMQFTNSINKLTPPQIIGYLLFHKTEPAFFFQNWNEIQKSIPHIPKVWHMTFKYRKSISLDVP
jgi:hypothetical protein